MLWLGSDLVCWHNATTIFEPQLCRVPPVVNHSPQTTIYFTVKVERVFRETAEKNDFMI